MRFQPFLCCLLIIFLATPTCSSNPPSTSPSESSAILADLDKVQSRMAEFYKLYEQSQSKKIAMDYPTVTKTMLEQFLPLAREDAQNKQLWRAKFAVQDFNRSLDQSISLMKAYLKNPALAPNVPRYQTGQIKIDGLSFIGNRKDSTGNQSTGPIFFVGLGMFQQAVKDLPRCPGYGINIIQAAGILPEHLTSPAQVFPSEDKVDLFCVNDLVHTLDEAAKYNVKVDVMLGAHAFPTWARTKWPRLSRGGGNPSFCIDSPDSKQLIEKFLRIIIPAIKDKPALLSVCLTNEPDYIDSWQDWDSQPLFDDYLAKTYGNITAYNAIYSTKYDSFDAVHLPGFGTPQYYDYDLFNEQRFAAWHKWMADIVHSMAPDLPVHAKIQMEAAVVSRWVHRESWGIDPELFGRDLDLNGNDCIDLPAPSGEWMEGWQIQNMAYDIQRSLNRKPIFNSENHPTLDCDTHYVPPEHFRTVLWQGAIHGQSATTIWVWQRTDDPTYCLYGNLMDRPGCAEAVGMTSLDLNRFAAEVTALQNVKAPVAILYSDTSYQPDQKYSNSVTRAYTALNFCGIKIDFISSKQLLSGKAANYRMIVLPDAAHVTPEVLDAIATIPTATNLVLCGDSLVKDCYGRDVPPDQLSQIRNRSLCLNADTPVSTLWQIFRTKLASLKASPEFDVIDTTTNQPAWGIEWLPATVNGKTIINLVNLTRKPVHIKIVNNGKTFSGTDMLSLGASRTIDELQPITPSLAQVTP